MKPKEFNKIIKIVYQGIEADPTKVTIILRNDKTSSLINTRNTLLNNIQQRYSKFIHELVRISIYVKAKIISSREFNNHGWRQINLVLKPKFVLKGKEPFLFKEEFEVYYREYEYVPKERD